MTSGLGLPISAIALPDAIRPVEISRGALNIVRCFGVIDSPIEVCDFAHAIDGTGERVLDGSNARLQSSQFRWTFRSNSDCGETFRAAKTRTCLGHKTRPESPS